MVLLKEIRPARPDDVPAVTALVQSAYRGEASRAGWTTEADLLDGVRTTEDGVRDKVARSTGVVLVGLDEEGEVVACCELELRPGGVAYFGMFAVRPQLQAGGIGRAMLAAAEDEAVDRWEIGTVEMTVIAQRTELIEWYERRGYVRTGETRPFPYGQPAFGDPRRDDLHFVVLVKHVAGGDVAVTGAAAADG